MTDVVDPATRSRMMAGIKRSHTAPELLVRSYLHRAGLRFRLHRGGLAGTPDIVLPTHRAVVFVHGCFWHRHAGCRFATTPQTRQEFWMSKFSRNVERDLRQQHKLQQDGWQVFVVWGCEASDELVLDRLVWSLRALR